MKLCNTSWIGVFDLEAHSEEEAQESAKQIYQATPFKERLLGRFLAEIEAHGTLIFVWNLRKVQGKHLLRKTPDGNIIIRGRKVRHTPAALAWSCQYSQLTMQPFDLQIRQQHLEAEEDPKDVPLDWSLRDYMSV